MARTPYLTTQLCSSNWHQRCRGWLFVKGDGSHPCRCRCHWRLRREEAAKRQLERSVLQLELANFATS